MVKNLGYKVEKLRLQHRIFPLIFVQNVIKKMFYILHFRHIVSNQCTLVQNETVSFRNYSKQVKYTKQKSYYANGSLRVFFEFIQFSTYVVNFGLY